LAFAALALAVFGASECPLLKSKETSNYGVTQEVEMNKTGGGYSIAPKTTSANAASANP